MPYSDPEKKKEYNKAYYQRNKARINADRIITDVKNDKQRCVREKTLLKYDEAFDNNQLSFLDNLVQNCKIERKQLYEMPPPQPIVEAPIIPNIPFVLKLPVERFFSENTNKDTFTIDEARTVIHGNRTVNNGRTEKSYYDKTNAIMTKFGLDRNIGLWSDVYKFGFKEIIKVLTKTLQNPSGYKNPSGYIVVLLYIYERSDKLKAIVDKQDKTNKLLEKLQEEYKDAQDREKVANRAAKKLDNTNYIQHYKDLFAIEDEFNKTEYASRKHLISLMYSKGLLDGKGNPILIPRNYFSDVELIENDDEIMTKPKTEGKGYNYYNYKKGRLYIQSYKTAPRYGAIDITLSKYTQKVIKISLEERPRKWLFVTKDNDKYADSSTFGNAIADTLGITVNQIRRAFINYYLYVVDLGRVVVAKLARHSVEVNESTYTTQQSNIAIQNTIYDENVINKKVNVKITEGKNKGMTLVGVVTRSLKPNRHKFNDRPGLAYSIKFNKNDNGGRIEEDEQATKIPDTSEGITMYVEPELEPGPGPSTRNTRSKGKGKGKKKKR
jgi:hypothetical protein